MLKQKISCFTDKIQNSLAEVSTHVISFVSLQVMRYSMHTTLKFAIVFFFPNMAFIAQPIILTL